MARVWLAQRESDLGLVAIKAAFDQSPEGLLRFQREKAALPRLPHPNVVSIFQVDELWYAMPFFEQGNLRQRLVHSRFALPKAVIVIQGVTRGLRCAHDQGIIHRDST
jgi:serine/threonine protein kinase